MRETEHFKYIMEVQFFHPGTLFVLLCFCDDYDDNDDYNHVYEFWFFYEFMKSLLEMWPNWQEHIETVLVFGSMFPLAVLIIHLYIYGKKT